MKIMFGRNVLCIMLLWWFMALGSYEIASYELSAEEDQELERQFQLLNKPAVTTIKTKYGDLYNCVDFYQQPAFDHPLLKDHKYDYQMSSSNNHQLNHDIKPSDIWLNGKGCPPNTVPIRRITKHDFLRAKIASDLAYTISTDVNPGVCVAVLRTTEQNKYYGGGMISTIYHPAVEATQYSSSRVKVQNGPDSIVVGWVVNPSLYPDNQTRLFIYTNTQNSHCYNTFCPGFILSSTEVPLDLLLTPYSQPGGKLYTTKFYLRKDPANGDWFLDFGLNNITVGSWPQKIFTGLADHANYVEWGGEVYTPPNIFLPQMGAGYQPTEDSTIDCYARKVNIINENEEVDYNPPSCEPYSNTKRYNLIDSGYSGGEYERLIFFGGP